MHGDELGSVRKGGFHLNLRDHFGDTVHHLATRDDVSAFLHELGHSTAVAGAFQDEIGDQRDGFWMVELDATVEPAPRHHRRHGDQKLILFARCEIHKSPFSSALEHDPEKWNPVFRKDHAQTKSWSGMPIEPQLIPL